MRQFNLVGSRQLLYGCNRISIVTDSKRLQNILLRECINGLTMVMIRLGFLWGSQVR
uniref:Uncharacterized protein n=1 Tax=Setaria italica TaxID=4555 RepID=K3Y0T1_SETIT